MKIQNSYIFIPQEKEQKNTSDTNEICLQKRFIEYILKIFGEDHKQIQSNTVFELYLLNFSLQDYIYKVYFHIKCIEKYIYLNVYLEENLSQKVIDVLEAVHKKFKNSKIEDNYVMIVSYDSISEYYCNKAYPKLNILERNLRQLFYETYVPMYGLDYITKIPEELKNNAKKVMRISSNSKKDIVLAQKFFYSLTFSNIKDFLFKKEWRDIEENYKEEFLNNHSDLSELNDADLRKAINELSPKSDWDRYFKDKIDNINIESLINSIQKNRNEIAHCKFFYKEDYEIFINSFNELNNEIEKAIKIIENNEIHIDKLNYLISSFDKIASGINEFQQNFQYFLNMSEKDISTFANNLANIARMASDYLEN